MEIKGSTILVTGAAGFIGYHVCQLLLARGATVIGLDNFNNYYDPALKELRNQQLESNEMYTLVRGDITDRTCVEQLFQAHCVDAVCHLAAQAGVRYSLQDPYPYIQTNLVGFTTVLHEAKNAGVKRFVYASSSSVYGDAGGLSEEASLTDKPISLYAATKKANELIAYTYHHLYGMHCTGLRFFTVYGPWGRPDMAYFSFTKDILEGKPITIFGEGASKRDFTYVEDIAEGAVRALEHCSGCEVINLGNNNPVTLAYFIETLEKIIGVPAKKEFSSQRSGDVQETHADIQKAKTLLSWRPETPLEQGLEAFVIWYKKYIASK